MESRKRFLVLHRNQLFRDCLRTFLVNECGHEVMSLDHTSVDPSEQLLVSPPDVVLVDLNLPEGLSVEISRAAIRGQSETKVIILVPDEHTLLVECIAAGAHGFILERSSLDDLNFAVQRVLQGEAFCSPDIVATMFSEITRLSNSNGSPASVEPIGRRLTNREQQVLELLNQRKSNKEIASELFVSLFTVKNHVRSILDKLNAENRMEAVDVAREQQRLSASTYSSRPSD